MLIQMCAIAVEHHKACFLDGQDFFSLIFLCTLYLAALALLWWVLVWEVFSRSAQWLGIWGFKAKLAAVFLRQSVLSSGMRIHFGSRQGLVSYAQQGLQGTSPWFRSNGWAMTGRKKKAWKEENKNDIIPASALLCCTRNTRLNDWSIIRTEDAHYLSKVMRLLK